MAFSRVLSAAVDGLSIELISVEADVSNGLPSFHMVGYLSSEVKEASERVRTAIKNAGFKIPPKRIVVNLAPATVRKTGTSFDLAIALSVLASMGMVPGNMLEETLVAGELSLDGRIRSVSGILPIVQKARESGITTCILPAENVKEGILVPGIQILGVSDLGEVCDVMMGKEKVTYAVQQEIAGITTKNPDCPDFQDVRGQEAVKRATEVAVAGGHNILMIGPPGSGKSMIASRIPGILPPMTLEECLEVTRVYSVIGKIDAEKPLITERPFRLVHHTVTRAALIGGGLVPMPGEISMSHNGVLFLDELAEFRRSVLEVLRQPLEEKEIRISRNNGSYVFPADFMLVAAMNPCPCGNYPDLNQCTCTPYQIQNYQSKISQPFLDRIDLCVEAAKIDYEMIKSKEKGESSAKIRERICRAREIQRRRFGAEIYSVNARITPGKIQEYCRLSPGQEQMMKKAFDVFGLTARTYHKILKVARTIADLEHSEQIQDRHLREAIGYRTKENLFRGRGI